VAGAAEARQFERAGEETDEDVAAMDEEDADAVVRAEREDANVPRTVPTALVSMLHAEAAVAEAEHPQKSASLGGLGTSKKLTEDTGIVKGARTAHTGTATGMKNAGAEVEGTDGDPRVARSTLFRGLNTKEQYSLE